MKILFNLAVILVIWMILLCLGCDSQPEPSVKKIQDEAIQLGYAFYDDGFKWAKPKAVILNYLPSHRDGFIVDNLNDLWIRKRSITYMVEDSIFVKRDDCDTTMVLVQERNR